MPPAPHPSPPLNGIFAVDKPLGISSMRAVSVVRRCAGGARTGHAGTLDPLATGVLVMAIGPSTRRIEGLMATDKRYETRIDLSAFTTTDDTEGERTEVPVDPSARPDATTIATLLGERFTGTILQRPPAFSAVKLGGRRAYALARAGKAPQPAPRPVTIHAVEVRAYDWPFLDLEIHCGKGTYVRSLARELGQALGTGGHCTSIRRTAVGLFTIDQAVPLEQVPQPLTQAWLSERAVLPDAPPASA